MMMLRALLLALSASYAFALCSYPFGTLTGGQSFWGGATSFADAAVAVGALYNKTSLAKAGTVGGYGGTGSGTGISNLATCQLVMAFSDDPMTAVQDSLFGGSRVTIPSVLSTYSFFTKGNKLGRKMTLTAKGTHALYSKGASPTAATAASFGGKVNNAFPTNQVFTRVGRSGKSGTNQLFRTFWNIAAGTTLPITAVQFGLDPADDITADEYFLTSSDVCVAVATKPFRIGYSVVGICKKRGATENSMVNKAGIAVNSAIWDPNGSIPRTTPPCTASYAAYNLLFQAGARSPPIASFIYSFARTSQNTPSSNSAFSGRQDFGKPANYNVNMMNGLVKIIYNTNFAIQLTQKFGLLPVPRNFANTAKSCYAQNVKP